MIHIIGGGTFSHVRNNLALAAPSFGATARQLHDCFVGLGNESTLHLTKMADPRSDLVTNNDVVALIDGLVADSETRVIIMTAALCEYIGKVVEIRYLELEERLRDIEPDTSQIPEADEEWFENAKLRGTEVFTGSGKYAPRLNAPDGMQAMGLFPDDKIERMLIEREDIFTVGFKATINASQEDQYAAALELLKTKSLDLVVANDTVTRDNMIVTPDETRNYETPDRNSVLQGLVDMVLAWVAKKEDENDAE